MIFLGYLEIYHKYYRIDKFFEIDHLKNYDLQLQEIKKIRYNIKYINYNNLVKEFNNQKLFQQLCRNTNYYIDWLITEYFNLKDSLIFILNEKNKK